MNQDPDDPRECQQCGRLDEWVRHRLNLPDQPVLCRQCFRQQIGEEACD